MKILIIGILVITMFVNVYGIDSEEIKVEELVKSTTSWDGSELPNYPQIKPEITILKITVPAGAELPMHQHPVINAGVLLEGELTVHTKAGKTLILKAGNPIVEVVNTWHFGKNEGEEPAVIIVFYAGEEGKEITVKE
ncbi:MAG: cupin domain-containing protein [Candidatus Cloacimonetes bacterium]|nr:cupin domain-containing protein [Candidatus Cloacimonadota bacterium]